MRTPNIPGNPSTLAGKRISGNGEVNRTGSLAICTERTVHEKRSDTSPDEGLLLTRTLSDTEV